jgi:hypothetical protein
MIIIYHLYSFFFKINNNKTIINHKSNSDITNISSGVIYTFINFYVLITVYNFIYFFILKGSVMVV